MYMGSSLVGSTHAESACLRAHALLLLSKLQGRGREDMEGGGGGLLKGLCSYLNLQGHIGSNMTRAWMTRSWPRAWNDEVNRIGGLVKAAEKGERVVERGILACGDVQSFFHSDSILTCDEQKRVGGLGCWVRILLRCRRDAAVIYFVLVPSSLLVLSAHRFALFQISSHLFNEQLIINTLSLRRQRNSPGIIDVPTLG